MQEKMDAVTAESVFNKIIASRRKLTIRDWGSDMFKEEKKSVLELIQFGFIRWDEPNKCIVYVLEQPLGKTEEVSFLSRDSIKIKLDIDKTDKNVGEKGIDLVCAYAQIKRHQYVDLCTSDEEYITMIYQLFLA